MRICVAFGTARISRQQKFINRRLKKHLTRTTTMIQKSFFFETLTDFLWKLLWESKRLPILPYPLSMATLFPCAVNFIFAVFFLNAFRLFCCLLKSASILPADFVSISSVSRFDACNSYVWSKEIHMFFSSTLESILVLKYVRKWDTHTHTT